MQRVRIGQIARKKIARRPLRLAPRNARHRVAVGMQSLYKLFSDTAAAARNNGYFVFSYLFSHTQQYSTPFR